MDIRKQAQKETGTKVVPVSMPVFQPATQNRHT